MHVLEVAPNNIRSVTPYYRPHEGVQARYDLASVSF